MSSIPDAESLARVFGALRAEYLQEDLYDLFTRPNYWPELLTERPCLLVGGRGTGKTTVLRGLSYEGQWHLGTRNVQEWRFVGIYWRIDTNAVTAFRGSEIDEETWSRLFAHYLNLIFCESVLGYLQWHESHTHTGEFHSLRDEVTLVARSLHIELSTLDLAHLRKALRIALIDFESHINNVAGAELPPLSLQGRPVQLLLQALKGHSAVGQKTVFFLIDEFENLEDYQQRVVNTLVKHSGTSYTFKIGMRETGHRQRATLNADEQLIEPADYALIDVARRLRDTDFGNFAATICDGRLRKLAPAGVAPLAVQQLLPGLTEAEEAEVLGVRAAVARLREVLIEQDVDAKALSEFDKLEHLQAYLIGYWAETSGTTAVDELSSFLASKAQWQVRLGNYQHAMLFTLRRGRRGLRKYYAGWADFVQLSEGNIRYLLQLLTEALQRHGREERTYLQPLTPLLQTEAAIEVGRRNLQELQGLAVEGAQLTKLVLGLGRVFQVMAAQPEGHAPEVNQFRVNMAGSPADADVAALLDAAVMHLAVVRFPGDKMAAVSGETRAYDYELHPIYAPFFTYSHRRKRRFTLDSVELLGLVQEPKGTIRQLLKRTDRDPDASLPDQLTLFGEFFE